MQTNSFLTVYNRYAHPTLRTEIWQRTQIVAPVAGRFSAVWDNTKASNSIKAGRLEADQATIYIPFVNGSTYVKPIAWQALLVKTGFWTLQQEDIVVRGLVTQEISDAFPAGKLKTIYDDVLTISSVDEMDQGSLSMRHWQVGAK